MRAARTLAWAAMVVAPLALGGCAEGGLAGGLRAAGVQGTPDEFMVLPTRPLEMPENLSRAAAADPGRGQPRRLPPAPRGGRRADRPPRRRYRERQPRSSPPPARATRRSAASSPPRTSSGARPIAGLLLERVFSRDREALVYQQMVLDAPAEFDRMRARGVEVPGSAAGRARPVAGGVS